MKVYRIFYIPYIYVCVCVYVHEGVALANTTYVKLEHDNYQG